jgi:hypothetical protein
VKGNPDIGALPQSVQLQQATNAYEAAKARLSDLEAGASNADLSGAQARVRQAQAQLDALKAAARPADIAAAEADVRRAAAQLALIKDGAALRRSPRRRLTLRRPRRPSIRRKPPWPRPSSKRHSPARLPR